MTDAELAAARTEVDSSLDSLWKWLEADAGRRVRRRPRAAGTAPGTHGLDLRPARGTTHLCLGR